MNRAVVLTALRVEYLAVKNHLTAVEEVRHQKGSIYEVGRFAEWEVLIAETGAGNTKAAVETERAISFFSPAIVMFVGVAGGLKDVQLGDVVAASKVYGYEFGKELEEFHARPDLNRSNYRLENLAKAEAKKPGWLERLSSSPAGSTPVVYVEPIAAGEKVVASKRSATFKFLRKQFSDAVAVEMEGHGCLTAVHANDDVKAIVVRGISDLIRKKSQSDAAGWQTTAAANASAFAFQLLSQIVPEQPPNPH